jgi:hypothetical protein
MLGAIPLGRPLWWGIVALVLLLAGTVTGFGFRFEMARGRRAALLCLLPAIGLAGGTAAWLWVYGDSGQTSIAPIGVIAIVTLAFALTHILVNVLKSRQSREAIAFRKRLSAARAFFASELRLERPALRDEWYPWLLALELGNAVDEWSAKQTAPTTTRRRGREEMYEQRKDWTSDSSATSTTGATTTPADSWSGFGGGRSGGAGGGASWAAAAGGFAAGVPTPSSSSSRSESSDSSYGSDSGSSYSSRDSSSSSSGGGGGGGW